MKKMIKSKKGSVIVTTALAMVVIIGFMALSIDVGYMVTTKNQLQAAVDAAALAGANGLLVSQADATNRAVHFASLNDCMNQPVVLGLSDISFPTANQIRVENTVNVNLFFARVLGLDQAAIYAEATAEIGKLKGTGDLKPWAIPDMQWPLGAPVLIKAGELGAEGTSSGFFYPVDYPPLNRGTPEVGAQIYEQKILDGAGCDVFIDDILQVEPGNQVGPTVQGVNALIDMDPNANWDGNKVADSAYPGFSSPRIIKVPLYDSNLAPDSGRNTVTVVGLGSFFLMGMSGRNVQGVFLEITTSGFGASGQINSTLNGVRLIK
ncbi:hypothetical protein JXQ31_03145 [candidate division KSB1 bacterium]|nr:hypothetical protein [candidate division KSB1 bacterium]